MRMPSGVDTYQVSWPDLSRWYWNLCRPHLEAVNDGLRQKVANYPGVTVEKTSGQFIGQPEPGVMAGLGVVGAGIAQPNHQSQ
jgi:hypothetical protein